MSFYHLEKGQEYLIDIKELLADYKTTIRMYWSGKDAQVLINKIGELERDYNKVIRSIDKIKRKIENAEEKIEEEKEKEEEN